MIQDYIEVTKPTSEDPIGELTDDGPGHKALEVLELCVKNYVESFPGPPNLTHLGQTCDQLFGSAKLDFGGAAEDLQKFGGKMTPVTPYDVGKLFAGKHLDVPRRKQFTKRAPLKDSFTREKIEKGWEKVRFFTSYQRGENHNLCTNTEGNEVNLGESNWLCTSAKGKLGIQTRSSRQCFMSPSAMLRYYYNFPQTVTSGH